MTSDVNATRQLNRSLKMVESNRIRPLTRASYSVNSILKMDLFLNYSSVSDVFHKF